jgi:hypothetical protein
LNREHFSYSGFSAIKDFNFDLYEFLSIYGYFYVLILLVLFFTLTFNKILIKNKEKKHLHRNSPKSSIVDQHIGIFRPIGKTRGLNSGFFAFLLILFILGALLPLNIFMYTNGIGISTVQPTAMPFKLVGITIYLRNYIAPLIIAYLYFKSNRNMSIALIILFYASFIGILSLSKGNIVLTCFPVLLFALLDRKIVRLSFAFLYVLGLYGFSAWSRQFVFLTDVGSFEMIQMIFKNVSIESLIGSLNIVNTFREFSFRLYGANVLVLAYQSNLEDSLTLLINFYLGQSESLDEIIFSDVFGLVAVDEVVIGVGMGYLGTVLLLTNQNVLTILLVSFITAIYLSVSEVIVRKYTSRVSVFAPAGYGFGFFMTFFIYDASIAKYYVVLLASLVGLFLMYFMRRLKYSSNNSLRQK